MTRTFREHMLRLVTGVLLAWLPMAWALAQANTLQTVSVARGSNDSQVVKITLGAAPAEPPVHFTTANPHRIVLDFAATQSSQGRLGETVDQGVIQAYNVVQAGERTRVVLNLAGPAQYQVRQVGNQVLVVVRGEKLEPETSAPARFAESGPRREHGIRDVEFKRGPAGEGRIIVHLSDPGVGVDIQQKGQAVQVDFLNTALPAPLQRRLDVSEFGTPAQSVETVEQGRNTRMKVEGQGRWDYSAYQTGERFILELRSYDDPRLQAAERPRYTGEKLTLNFQNVEIRAVLQVIADFTGLNIVASDTVTGNITLRLKDVPWDQALDIILRAKGLDKRTTGNVIWVAPRDELAAKEKLELEAKQQLADLEDMVVESIPLNYLRANEAQAILQGQSLAGLQAGEAVTCSAQATGVGGQAQTAAAAATGTAAAQRVLSKRGSATYDLKTNTLFVQDTPAKLREVREVLKKVDVPTRQVMIEARVVVADDTFGRALGARLTMGPIDANIGRTEFQNITGTSNLDAPTGAGSLATASSLAFQIVNVGANILLDLELQAMEADKRGKIVSNPRVITQNQKPAVILQGTQLPNVTPGTANSPATVTFKDAFLCLLVDPQILNNDNIILNVEVQKDAPGDSISLGGGGVAYPIDTKRVKTQVRVKNGETAILGGIFEQTVRNDTNKVPLLGDIPILGHLFKDNFKQDEKTELLIFLTPRILDDVALR